MIKLLLAGILWISLLITDLGGSTYYVGPTGNNANTGLSLGQAFRTLQRAANAVIAGDSVLVVDSTYVGFDLRTSGTAANPIIFMALGTQAVINRRNSVTQDGINIENANWIEIRGFRVINQPRAGIRAVFANNITIRFNTCLNNQRWGIFTGFTDDFLAERNECANSVLEHGIYVSNSSDRAIIRNNISHHNRAAGLHFNGDISQGGDGINHDPQVYNNIIYQNGLGGGSAINMDGNQNALIYNNLIYDNHATGIALYQIDGGGPSTGARIYHNTIVQDPVSRWAILLTNGASGADIKNNILINQHATRGTINVFPDSRAGLSSDYNIMTNRFTLTDGNSVIDSTAWRLLGYDLHSYFTPSLTNLFMSYSGANFNLAAGSRAINVGVTGLNIPLDLIGNNRVQGPAPDLGALESSSTALPLHWKNYVVRHIGHQFHIQGTILDMDIDTRVCLEKWVEYNQNYVSIAYKDLPSQSGMVSVHFEQPAIPGLHRYRLVATEQSGQIHRTKDLVINNELQHKVTIYPNPASSLLTLSGLSSDQVPQVMITDVYGRVLLKDTYTQPLNITNLPSGMYWITWAYRDLPSTTERWFKL